MRSLFPPKDPTQIKCSSAELSLFTRQFSAMIGAGIPIQESLWTLGEFGSDPLSERVIPAVRKQVSNGARLSSAMSRFPRVFPSTYIAVLKAAEESGKLLDTLDQLAEWLERGQEVEREVKKALSYPVLVTVLAVAMTVALFRTLVPKILQTVTELGVELPMPTRVLQTMVDMLGQPLFWFVAVLVGMGVFEVLRRDEGREKLLLMLSHTPVVGGILVYSAAVKYARTLALLLDSGVDMLRAVALSSQSSSSPFIARDTNRVLRELSTGEPLAESLGTVFMYPPILVQMVGVGAEVGRLSYFSAKAAEILEQDARHRIEIFMNLLEPIVLSGIALMVGFVVIATLMPLSSLVSAL